MAVLIRPRAWGQQKPPPGSCINWGHPLANGLIACVLFNEQAGSSGTGFAGSPRDIARNVIVPYGINDSTGSIRIGKRGGVGHQNGLDTGSSSSGWTYLNSKWLPTAACTVVVAKRKLDATNRASEAFGAGTTNTDRLGCHLPYSDGVVYWDFGSATAPNRLTYSGATFGDDVWAFTAGHHGSTIWQNGGLKASSSTAISRSGTGGASQIMTIGNGQPGTTQTDLADLGFFYMWNRELSGSEIHWLNAEPYAFIAQPAPAQRYWAFVAAPPAFPFGQEIKNRRLKGLPKRGRIREVVPPQRNPPPAPTTIRGNRLRGLPKRGRIREVVPKQQNPPYPWRQDIRAVRLRGLPRKGRIREVVPAQQNPPKVWQQDIKAHRLRGLPRKGRIREVVPDQPFSWRQDIKANRLRGLPRKGRMREAPITQAQPAASPLVFMPSLRRVLRGWPQARGHSREVIRSQLNPPYPWRQEVRANRLRGLPRRGRIREVVPSQQNPPKVWQQDIKANRLRGLPRKGKVVTPTPGQAHPVEEVVRGRRLRGWPAPRGRSREVVQRQLDPPYPWRVEIPGRRLRGWPQGRGHSREAVPLQSAPIEQRIKAHRLRGLPRRGRIREVVPKQPNPPYPIQQDIRARRLRGWPRRGRVVEVTQPQFNPIYAPRQEIKGRRIRGLLSFWRRKRFEVVPERFIPPPPPIVIGRQGVGRGPEQALGPNQQSVERGPEQALE